MASNGSLLAQIRAWEYSAIPRIGLALEHPQDTHVALMRLICSREMISHVLDDMAESSKVHY
jgi:hypothetical protein